MSDSAHPVTHDDVEPITDHVHETSWSANLERQMYEQDRELLRTHAIDAIEHTAPGVHVNLVTHEAHGHPTEALFPALAAHFGDDDGVTWEYVDQCGCGGYVTRVDVSGE